MSERCIVRVKWDPATSPSEVGRAVGGFLRYIQHRDVHPDSSPSPKPANVAGLTKYVAYRDQASTRAELFVPEGKAGSAQRKQFTAYVARSIEESKAQLYRARDGRLLDRRRAVSRFVISPERAQGLDLERLLRAGVARLESEMGVSDLRWIAAIHRNTAHHHAHFVLAGLHRRDDGSYVRVDINKSRLTAIKEAIAQEIVRQRGERLPAQTRTVTSAGQAVGGKPEIKPALKPLAMPPRLIRTPPTTLPARRGAFVVRRHPQRSAGLAMSILRLRAIGRRYQRRMQHEAETEARQMRWERSA